MGLHRHQLEVLSSYVRAPCLSGKSCGLSHSSTTDQVKRCSLSCYFHLVGIYRQIGMKVFVINLGQSIGYHCSYCLKTRYRFKRHYLATWLSIITSFHKSIALCYVRQQVIHCGHLLVGSFYISLVLAADPKVFPRVATIILLRFAF